MGISGGAGSGGVPEASGKRSDRNRVTALTGEDDKILVNEQHRTIRNLYGRLISCIIQKTVSIVKISAIPLSFLFQSESIFISFLS